MAVAAYPRFIAQRLLQGLAQGDAHVFNGMMGVYFQVPFGADVKIEHAVPGHLFQHMFEKRNSDIQLRRPAAIEIQADGDIGLLGFPVDGCCTFAFHWRASCIWITWSKVGSLEDVDEQIQIHRSDACLFPVNIG